MLFRSKMKITKKKERKYWIPNQVGDDIGVVFGDDNGMVFKDESGDVIPATYFCHSRILSLSFPRLRESIRQKTGSPIKLGMTMVWFSGMTVGVLSRMTMGVISRMTVTLKSS